ncbi:hypothetical protein GQ602_000700 [Ophiocordyceps camponoti-floridani]|uniref:Uncharacterized protein n=1 Tax=Ophiocordyceps camponoti-floridani TaxID=2030778 RepID=A0A8H4QCS2_9HYPO|nr:hypothetical protein GQ602_000700 [Ophiocordyceps camponoti-floridani]
MKSSPAIILRARTSLIESQRYHKCFGVYWATDAIPPAQNSRVSTVRPAPFLESVLELFDSLLINCEPWARSKRLPAGF